MPAAETVSVADSVPTAGVALGVRGGIEQLCSRFTKFPKVKTCPVVFCVFRRSSLKRTPETVLQKVSDTVDYISYTSTNGKCHQQH